MKDHKLVIATSGNKDYSKNSYNSSGGLLNPNVFAAFLGGVIEAQFDFFNEIMPLTHQSTTNTSDFSIYVKVKIPLTAEHPSLGKIRFHSQAYVGQLFDIIEKIEAQEVSIYSKIYIKIESLQGYDWFKPILYYDSSLSTKIPDNNADLKLSDLEQKIQNLYRLLEASKNYQYKTGDFFFNRNGTLGLVLKPYKDGYISFFHPAIRIIYEDNIVSPALEIPHEKKKDYYDDLNSIEYSGKWKDVLEGVKHENFSISIKKPEDVYGKTYKSFDGFLDRLKPQVGDFIVREILPTDDNNYRLPRENTFLVLKMLEKNVLLYPIDMSDRYITMPQNHDLYTHKVNPTEDKKKEIYNEINNLIYYGIHLEVANNIDNPLFSLTTINDTLQNPIFHLSFNRAYKTYLYFFENTSIIFQENGNVSIHSYKIENLTGHYKALEDSILVNIKKETDSKIYRFCVKVFKNGVITICPFSDEGLLNNAHMGSLS